MRFDELQLSSELHEAVESFGFEELTTIQEKTFSPIISGNDIIACSQTGSGKTVAFLLPMMEKMLQNPTKGIAALIIAPTRELCQQIEAQIAGLAYFSNQSSIAIYGGNDHIDFGDQKNALVNGVDIIVATPGRLISHLNLGYADFSNLQFLVLDEADEMLDMGFYPDIMKIEKEMPKSRQTLMFSATMPLQIRKLAEKILINPEHIDLNFSKPAAEIDQQVFCIFEKDKPQLLLHILAEHKGEKVIIFVSTKQKVGDVAAFLRRNNIANRPINSNFTQEEREAAVLEFKSGKTNIIVTTNLLARGIDIENVNLILNYEIPAKAEDYVHRIGRTARAGKDGIAVSFISEKDMHCFGRIEQLLGRTIDKSPLPENFPAGPEYKIVAKKSYRRKRKFNSKAKNNKNQPANKTSKMSKPQKPRTHKKTNNHEQKATN